MKRVIFIAVLAPLVCFHGCDSKEKSGKVSAPVVDNSIVSASFNPDGKKILVAHKSYVILYDATSGAVLKTISRKIADEEFLEKLFQ